MLGALRALKSQVTYAGSTRNLDLIPGGFIGLQPLPIPQTPVFDISIRNLYLVMRDTQFGE